ncbi:MAG: hypothetical protein FJ045_04165 [Crenarchaeota archaeon]|nr:hypothetical protein [Thermoproteota archaeon]
MNLKQNPFSLYDFLGYLIPGALFLYAAALAIVWMEVGNETSLLKHLLAAMDRLDSQLALLHWQSYVPLAILAYTIGHFLSFLSSISIEKFMVWTCGYPSKFLLTTHEGHYLDIKAGPQDSAVAKFIRRFNRAIVFVFLTPISAVDQSLGILFGTHKQYSKTLDSFLQRSIRRRMDSFLRENYVRDYTRHEDGEEYPLPKESDFFRGISHFALENAPGHVQPMQNYVALYGFLRTVSFVFVLLFWTLPLVCLGREFSLPVALLELVVAILLLSFLLLISTHEEESLTDKQRVRVWPDRSSLYWSIVLIALSVVLSIVQMSWLMAVSAALSYLSYVGFQKFYRRYTLEAFMALMTKYKGGTRPSHKNAKPRQ